MTERKGQRHQNPSGGRAAGRGFRSVAVAAERAVSLAASRRGFSERDVLTNWPEIVGHDLAPCCRPLRITYGRAPEVGATLVVDVDGARAAEVAHLSSRILEKVNSYCGFRAVSRLKISQGGMPGMSEAAARFQHDGSEVTPSPRAVAEAARLTSGVEDAALRESLARLGAHVFTRGARADR